MIALRPWLARLLPVLRTALTSHHTLVLALYLLLSWVVMFGTRASLSEHSFAGGLDHDAGTYVWYLHHLKEALFGDGELLFSDRMFYPMGMNMVRQDWTPTTSALGLPFSWAGELGAYNLEILLAFVLCGYFTYLLGLRLSGNRAYAFVAGMIFAFCEFRILKACYHGHLTHINQQFIPLYLYFLVAYTDARRLHAAASSRSARRARGPAWQAFGAGLCFFLATFCTPYQMVFLLVFSVPLVLYRVGSAGVEPGWPPRLRLDRLWQMFKASLAFTALAAGSAVLLVTPLFIAMPWEAMSLGAGSLSGFSPEFSADLLSYIMPTLGKEMGWPNFSGEGGCAFQGYSVLVLFFFGCYYALRYKSGTGQWIFMALYCFLLSLGSVLVIGGKQLGALPFYAVLEQIPIVRGARVASRFSIGVTLSMACIACVTLALAERRWLTSWSRRRLWILRGVIILVVGGELLSHRIKLTVIQRIEPEVFPLPRTFQNLAKQQQDSSVLVYPLTWEIASDHIGPLHFPRGHYYYLTVHRKRLITGFGDAVPATTLAYFRRVPLLRELVSIEAGKEVATPDFGKKQDARYVADFLDIWTVLVNRRKVAREQRQAAQRATRAVRYVKQALGYQELKDIAGITVFSRDPSPDSVIPAVEFARPASFVHLGSAWWRSHEDRMWHAQVNPMGRETEILLLKLPPTGASALTVTMRCNQMSARLAVVINGQPMGQVDCPARWKKVRIPLSGHPRRSGVSRLYLRLVDPQRQAWVPVGKTGVKTRARIRVTSQGLEAGNSASILLGAVDLAPNARGYNVSIIDPATGHNLSSAAFDFIGKASKHEDQALLMARLIQAVPRGMIVCAAVKDDGSMGFRNEVTSALLSIGAQLSDRPGLRASYAIIGVKGANRGTALEGMSDHSAVTLEVGSLLQIRKVEVK